MKTNRNLQTLLKLHSKRPVERTHALKQYSHKCVQDISQMNFVIGIGLLFLAVDIVEKLEDLEKKDKNTEVNCKAFWSFYPAISHM